MQNFTISYLLENTFDKIEKSHLILSDEVFTDKDVKSIFNSYITLNNHNSLNCLKGINQCLDVITKLTDDNSVNKKDLKIARNAVKAIHDIDSNPELFLIREIIITVKLISNEIDQKTEDIKAFLGDKISELNIDNKSDNPGSRLFSAINVFRNSHLKVSDNMIVYTIYNTNK